MLLTPLLCKHFFQISEFLSLLLYINDDLCMVVTLGATFARYIKHPRVLPGVLCMYATSFAILED